MMAKEGLLAAVYAGPVTPEVPGQEGGKFAPDALARGLLLPGSSLPPKQQPQHQQKEASTASASAAVGSPTQGGFVTPDKVAPSLPAPGAEALAQREAAILAFSSAQRGPPQQQQQQQQAAPCSLAGALSQLRRALSSFKTGSSLYCRKSVAEVEKELNVEVLDWDDLQHSRLDSGLQHRRQLLLSDAGPLGGGRTPAQRGKGQKAKTPGMGRKYTSRYRGVHQTFPTQRWEAQFRKGGKPTSLGCFDEEEQAARAYDKMMLWCELHQQVPQKNGITNFDPNEYDPDVAWLQGIDQDALVKALRSEGRTQAQSRQNRLKKGQREGLALEHSRQGVPARGSQQRGSGKRDRPAPGTGSGERAPKRGRQTPQGEGDTP